MSEGAHKRAVRVAHTLHHALSALLTQGLRDPRIGLVTVTEVRMADDLRSARIFVSAYGDEEARKASLLGLSAAARYLRREISAELKLRFAPTLYFVADETLLHAERLENLLSAASHGDTEPPSPDLKPSLPAVHVDRQPEVSLAGTPLLPGKEPMVVPTAANSDGHKAARPRRQHAKSNKTHSLSGRSKSGKSSRRKRGG